MPDELSPSDDPQMARRIEAARGYCELGLPDLAREEIAPLRRRFAGNSEVIETELLILMQERSWTQALKLANLLREQVPEHPAGWLQSAFCLHELGRTAEALAGLSDGPPGLQQEALFHYNSACYLAVLGRSREALAALRRAFKIDPAYRKNAAADADLAALRDQI